MGCTKKADPEMEALKAQMQAMQAELDKAKSTNAAAEEIAKLENTIAETAKQETTASENGSTLTVFNISSEFNNYYIISLVRSDIVLQFSKATPPSNAKIAGSSIELIAYQWIPGGEWEKFTGNITLNEGELIFILTTVNPSSYELPPVESTYGFANRRAIIFTNGSATVDFFTGLIEVDPYDYMSVSG